MMIYELYKFNNKFPGTEKPLIMMISGIRKTHIKFFYS